MKKLFLSTMFISACFISNAQVDEEAIFLTGGLSFGSSDAMMEYGAGEINAKAFDFGLAVGGGYMFTEMFGAGLKLGYGMASLKSDAEGINQSLKASVFNVAPFVRSYIEIDEPLYAMFDFTAGFGFGNNAITQDVAGTVMTMDQKFNTLDINISPGFSYFLSDNFALELWYGYIGYNSMSQNVDDGTGTETKMSQGSFMFNADLSTIRFGITYMFNN